MSPVSDTKASGPDPAESVPKELLERILGDAARSSRTSASAVTLVSAERVTWADTSLGCERKDVLARQVLTPGYRVVLKAGNDEFVYHASRSGNFVACPPERRRPPVDVPDPDV